MESSTPGNETAVVAEPSWVPALVWIGFPLAGAAVGWLFDLVVSLVASLPAGPFHGAFELADSIPDPQGTIGSIVLGGLAGTALAYQAGRERLTVTVSAERVGLVRRGSVREIERESVSVVFLDGKRLVLLGPDSEELAREQCELPAGRLRAAFLAHGFSWRDDGDPYQGDYRRWVAAVPDLPVSVNALLNARARALARGEKAEAAELRAELAKVGIVIRDEKTGQSWRYAGSPPPA
jgi:hypothetical protein